MKVNQHRTAFQIIKMILDLTQMQHLVSKRIPGRTIHHLRQSQKPDINLDHAISDQNTAAMKKETDLQEGKDLQTLFLCKYYGLVKKVNLHYGHAWIVD